MERELFDQVTAWDNHEILKIEKGHVAVATEVKEQALNPYGKTHGGFLYTICDTVAGAAGAANGYYVVTLQANINYIAPAKLHDRLAVEATTSHCGRTTQVIDLTVCDQNERLICKGSFTLYNVKAMENNDWFEQL